MSNHAEQQSKVAKRPQAFAKQRAEGKPKPSDKAARQGKSLKGKGEKPNANVNQKAQNQSQKKPNQPNQSNDHWLPGDMPLCASPWQVKISHLAAHAESINAFVQTAYRTLHAELGCRYSELILEMADGHIQDYQHQGQEGPAFWKSPIRHVIDDCMTEHSAAARVYQSKKNQGPDKKSKRVTLLLAVPMIMPGQGHGAIGMVLADIRQKDVDSYLMNISSASALISSLTGNIAEKAAITSGNYDIDLSAQAIELAANGKSAKNRSAKSVAYYIANTLANQLGCEQVAVGEVQGKRVKLQCISGFDEFNQRHEGVKVIVEAMEECLDNGRPIVCHAGELQHNEHSNSAEANEENKNDKRFRNRPQYGLHRAWLAQCHSSSSVASLPLHGLVISLRSRPGIKLSSALLKEVESQLGPAASALKLTKRSQRSLMSHMTEAAGKSWLHLFWPLKRFIILSILAGFCYWLATGWMPLNIHAPATVTPEAPSTIAAPFDGVLKSNNLVPGTPIKAGDVVAELDTTELSLRLTSLNKEIRSLRIEEGKLFAENLMAEQTIMQARREALEAERDLIGVQIKQSKIYAGQSGSITKVIYEHAEDQPVRRGEMLYEVDGMNGWLLQMMVKPSDLRFVAVGQTISFISPAKPRERISGVIARIHPAIEQDQAVNLHRVDVKLDESAKKQLWLAQGVEGIAKLDAGKHKAWWVLFRPLIQKLELYDWWLNGWRND